MECSIIQKKRGISQEGLKLFACFFMLIDHIGAVLLPQYFVLRLMGRVSFPIFCFLLAEGAHYTRNPKKYATRLGIGALLSEIPFDCAFFGGITMSHCSVMVTLLLGFAAIKLMERVKNPLLRVLAVIPFLLAADLLNTDYSGMGVLLVVLMDQSRKMKHPLIGIALSMAVFCTMLRSAMVSFWGIRFSCEWFCLLSLLPIALYSGRKATHSKAVQWGFYLFYPVHITIIWLISLFV